MKTKTDTEYITKQISGLNKLIDRLTSIRQDVEISKSDPKYADSAIRKLNDMITKFHVRSKQLERKIK